jgi:hypothetical protein
MNKGEWVLKWKLGYLDEGLPCLIHSSEGHHRKNSEVFDSLVEKDSDLDR